MNAMLSLKQQAMQSINDDVQRVELIRGDSIKAQAIDWLWRGWLAAGKLHLIGGQPGTGKTTIALSLAAAVTKGGLWPDGTRATRGTIAVWSGEDDVADTLVPRLRAAGADMAKVYIINGVRHKGERYAFDPANDTPLLADALAGVDDLRLLIVDPIVSAISGDSHKNAEVRRGLQPLVDLANSHRCALLGITHFTKGTAGREPVERITGSLAFVALARVVLVTARADEKDGELERLFMARAKSNIGPDGGGFEYGLRQDDIPGSVGVSASSVVWGVALEGAARELLAVAEKRDDDEQGQDAAGFLRELLFHGARPVKEIYQDADGAGFSRDQMKRAKSKIGVITNKSSMNEGWVWQLPRQAKLPEGSKSSAEGSEGSAQFYPHPSLPSGEEALPSGDCETVEI
jgi:hypothetical protein